ncbi:MAG: D-tyrosyl-tRNA(Tyr) deacylase [Saprospiraceae bacterium]|nr:D-tyrosyl-tRNA(Tyr) deacylase [Saprospiraceae bacterium]
MKIVLQRVTEAELWVNDTKHCSIGTGMLILLGIHKEDQEEDINWLVKKISSIRIFSDTEGKMNLDLMQINGEIMVVSQFTLFASTKKGNRPGFTDSARPDQALQLYDEFCVKLANETGIVIKRGVFGADMKIKLINDGPVTIIIDSKNKE